MPGYSCVHLACASLSDCCASTQLTWSPRSSAFQKGASVFRKSMIYCAPSKAACRWQMTRRPERSARRQADARRDVPPSPPAAASDSAPHPRLADLGFGHPRIMFKRHRGDTVTPLRLRTVPTNSAIAPTAGPCRARLSRQRRILPAGRVPPSQPPVTGGAISSCRYHCFQVTIAAVDGNPHRRHVFQRQRMSG